MQMLEEKVALITGASSGIGLAAARLFAREGAAVVVTARRQAELDRLVADITASGGRAVALAGDVRNEDHARALVGLARQKFGGLDIAFNNAGSLGEMGPVSRRKAGARPSRSTSRRPFWAPGSRFRRCWRGAVVR